MSEEIVKVCKVHGDITSENVEIRIRKRLYLKKNGEFSEHFKSSKICRLCSRVKKKNIYQRNKKCPVFLKKRKDYQLSKHCKNLGKIRRKNKRDENPELCSLLKRQSYVKFADRERNRQRKQRFELHDLYLKSLIRMQTGFKNKEIPSTLVSLKKVQMMIFRKLNNKNGIKICQ